MQEPVEPTALLQKETGTGVRFVRVGPDLDAEAQEVLYALDEVVRNVAVRSGVDACRIVVEQKLDAVAWPRSGRIGLCQLVEKLNERGAHRRICLAHAFKGVRQDLLIAPLCPCLKVGNEQLGDLAGKRMVCSLDVSARPLESALNIPAAHPLLLQQVTDISPELLVNALIDAKDGPLGKPALRLIGLSQKASLQGAIRSQDTESGSEDLTGATELVAILLDRRGMRLGRLERVKSASLLLFVELAHVFIKLRPVADDNDGISIEIAVELFLFAGGDGNQRPRSERLGGL
ncbi:hypothetical protein ILFOPFJJ_06994 [Ensifer psoraleae]|nr:hypothetical protein [Sinorhizobium psoraleae]